MMSAAKIIKVESGLLGIQKLIDQFPEPSVDFLLSENEKTEFRNLKNIQRKKEFLAVRSLLKEMAGEKIEILYDPAGKPRLKNSSLHISISHSSDLAIVLLTHKNAGVDVENIHRKISSVAKRFLSENEFNAVKNAPDPQLSGITYWCAKEAAFKFSDTPGIEFKTGIAIFPFICAVEGGNFSGELRKEGGKVILDYNYLFLENNVVVYCVDKE